jgi:hypothetical protein
MAAAIATVALSRLRGYYSTDKYVGCTARARLPGSWDSQA